jgi:hypothetical protein
VLTARARRTQIIQFFASSPRESTLGAGDALAEEREAVPATVTGWDIRREP